MAHSSLRRMDHASGTSGFGADRGPKAIRETRNDRTMFGTAWMIGPGSAGESDGDG